MKFPALIAVPLIIALVIVLFGSLKTLAATNESLKYSQVKKLSYSEVEDQFVEFTGSKDTWKNNSFRMSRIKNLISFKKKTTRDEDRLNLSYIHAKKNPQSLQQMVLASQNSQYEEIQRITVNIQGDKAMVRNVYMRGHNYDLRSLLFFFKTLESGDTGLETKKFSEFATAFESLAYEIKLAAQRATVLSLPMILEFESSALMPKSPFTRLFFNTVISDKSRILKVEITPDGGRLVSIHPFYAREIAQNIDLFSNQFSKKVRTLKSDLFKDPEAKQRLVDLLRYGEGLSGVLYTDERILELVLEEKGKIGKPNTCAKLFN